MLIRADRLSLRTYHQRLVSDYRRLMNDGPADMPDRPSTENLRALPSVDTLLRTPEAQALRTTLGAEHLTALARTVTDALRDELRSRDETLARDGDGESRASDGAQTQMDGELTRESLLAEAARR